jgi:hypothetical protein
MLLDNVNGNSFFKGKVFEMNVIFTGNKQKEKQPLKGGNKNE